jgi:carboxylesterase
MSEPRQLIPGAEPWSSEGGSAGVLVLHGFTGNPDSMRSLAEAFAGAGFTVSLPLLPGHGTVVDDMLTTSWDDWSATAEAEYLALCSKCDHVVVAGLSMGGTLATWLAARHPEIAGAVLVNPAVEPIAEPMLEMVRQLLDQGNEVMDGIGSDIADPDVTELAYPQTPLRPLLSLGAAVEDLSGRLADIACPVLLLTSRQDHVVPPSNSEYLAAHAGGPVEHVWLERSYHVATQDYDKAEIEQRAVEFARKVTSG